MTVTKHDIEWLIRCLEEYSDILPPHLLEESQSLIEQSGYRESVCVIYPMDESNYHKVRQEIRKYIEIPEP